MLVFLALLMYNNLGRSISMTDQPVDSKDETEVRKEAIIIGATPLKFETWSIAFKIGTLLLLMFVIVTNSTVIALYHQVRRRVTIHELHVCHLAVVDLLAGLLAIFPAVGAHIKEFKSLGKAFLIPCFIASLGTLTCSIMATIICIIISYDRLRLLQLGIRYHLVQTRLAGIIQLTVAWIAIIVVTVVSAVLIIFTPLGKPASTCAYSVNSDFYVVKAFMTLTALGPLFTLVCLNCLVRHKVRELEERHPQVINRSRSSSLGRTLPTGTRNEGMDVDVSTGFLTVSGELSMGQGTSSAPSEEPVTPVSTYSRTAASSETNTLSKTNMMLRSIKSERSLSRRATASIFVSTLTFIICLSPLTAMLLIEAWRPNTITTTTHIWHLWLTLIRTAIDPFLFARSVPSFRLQYGTTMILWEQRSGMFYYLRRMSCYYFDKAVVKDAQERLDRRKRGSPAQLRGSSKTSMKKDENKVQSLQEANFQYDNGLKTISVESDQRIVLVPRIELKTSGSTHL